jgi:dTDP-4-dehydrorhamnose 3,5-epimerase
MIVNRTRISDVIVLEPKVFGDDRGYFMETYSRRMLADAAGIDVEFVQDNHSRSVRGVLRGLHYQVQHTQGKLLRVIEGEIYDVAVDLRKSSPTFGQWVDIALSAENRRQIWIPQGFAHGFYVVSEAAQVLYKTTDYYAPDYERCISWNDPQLNIPWPVEGVPELSVKDRNGMPFTQAEYFP